MRIGQICVFIAKTINYPVQNKNALKGKIIANKKRTDF